MPGQRKAAPAPHGGYRAPAKPAAVSGPGALSQRTDGGPAQPVRPIPSSGPGSTIGDRQASVALQQGAPLSAGGEVPPPAEAGQVAVPGGPSLPDPFGPTRRPNEPLTAGATLGAGRTPGSAGDTTLDLLRGIYAAYPYDGVRSLIEELETSR